MKLAHKKPVCGQIDKTIFIKDLNGIERNNIVDLKNEKEVRDTFFSKIKDIEKKKMNHEI